MVRHNDPMFSQIPAALLDELVSEVVDIATMKEWTTCASEPLGSTVNRADLGQPVAVLGFEMCSTDAAGKQHTTW